jgi:hypothetical protein
MGWFFASLNSMKKLFAVLAILTIFFLFSQPAQAIEEAGHSAVLKNEVLGFENPDARVEKLEAYLESHRSPLEAYASVFVEAADRYQLDWRLVPAITGVESTFGKQIPFNSYNAYGWANGLYRFQSWEESIKHVYQYLRVKYLDRGLDTPYKIGPVYAPPSHVWGAKVAYFMGKIESFGSLPASGLLALTL